MSGTRTNSGKALNALWKVGARQSRFHKDGNWYMPLTLFPSALFDPNGYVVFTNHGDYVASPYLRRGERLNVPGGIASMPGYVVCS